MTLRTWFRLRFGRLVGLKTTSIAVAGSAAENIVAADKMLDAHEATLGVHNIALRALTKRKAVVVDEYSQIDSRAKDLLASL